MEALVLLLILLVALGVYGLVRWPARDQAPSAAELRAQLTRQEQSLRHAREQNWDRERIHQISEQLDDTRFQLAQAATRLTK